MLLLIRFGAIILPCGVLLGRVRSRHTPIQIVVFDLTDSKCKSVYLSVSLHTNKLDWVMLSFCMDGNGFYLANINVNFFFLIIAVCNLLFT